MERTPEPELMEGASQVLSYSKADFESSDRRFVATLFKKFPDLQARKNIHAMDLGCGPAKIAAELCFLNQHFFIRAIDGSAPMLKEAQRLLHSCRLQKRIQLVREHIPCDLDRIGPETELVLSNSLLHHIKNPAYFWQSIKTLKRKDLRIMIVDLIRPKTEAICRQIVQERAHQEPPELQKDFFLSLRASYTIDEINDQLEQAKIPLICESLSDIHWIVYGKVYR